jgi:predicted O-methyltransferase YrrM
MPWITSLRYGKKEPLNQLFINKYFNNSGKRGAWLVGYMKQLFLIKQYLKYRLKAKNLHGVHSPFVYAFNKDVVNDTRHFYAFDAIADLRKNLLQNTNTITITDFGAGSKHTNSNVRRICDIAKLAGKRHEHGALLYRMVDAYNCTNILELGTSMGLGTAYMASANTSAKVHTIEGCSAIAKQASLNFERLVLMNIQQYVGDFDVVLPDFLQKSGALDFVFVDGNHLYKPTIAYFEMLLPKLASKAFLVFDDIHWSKEMHDAWQVIIADKRVMLSIDVFQFGICVFDPSFKEKQHFIIKL